MEDKKVILVTGMASPHGAVRLAAAIARLRTLGVSMVEVSQAANKFEERLKDNAEPLKIINPIYSRELHRTDILTQSQKRDPAYQRHEPHYKYHR